MKKLLTFLLALVSFSVFAAQEDIGGFMVRFSGTASADNALLFTTSDLYKSTGMCTIMSTTGAVDVEATLDGTNWTTAPLQMQDLGATTVDPVNVTVALRMYAVLGPYRYLRVRENGATAAAASLLCRLIK